MVRREHEALVEGGGEARRRGGRVGEHVLVSAARGGLWRSGGCAVPRACSAHGLCTRCECHVECVHVHRVRDEVDAQRRGSVRDHRVARARRAPLDKVEVEQDVRRRRRRRRGGVVLRMQVDEARALSLGARAQCGGLTRRWAEREARDLQMNGPRISVVCLPTFLSVLSVLPVSLDLHARRVVAAQHGGQ